MFQQAWLRKSEEVGMVKYEEVEWFTDAYIGTTST